MEAIQENCQSREDPPAIKLVDQCRQDTGDLDANGVNTLLESELEHGRRSGVHTLPAITINNHHPLSWTTPHALFDALCTEYWLSGDKTIPTVCIQCASCPNVIGCLEQNGKCVGFDNAQ